MTETTAPQHTFLGRMLDTIERVGNKVPHPAIIFIILIAGVIVLSQLLFWAGVSVTYDVAEPPPVAGEVGYPSGSSVEVPQVPCPRTWTATTSSRRRPRSRGCSPPTASAS